MKSISFLFIIASIQYFTNANHLHKCPKVHLENGNAVLKQAGAVLKFNCDDEYLLIGAKESRCINGKWTTLPPACVADNSPPVLENGNIQISEDENTITYSCNEGFQLIGSKQLTWVDEKWSSDIPYCTPELKNGNIQISEDGNTYIYSCNEGFQLIGSKQLTWVDEKWSSDMPYCTPNDDTSENESDSNPDNIPDDQMIPEIYRKLKTNQLSRKLKIKNKEKELDPIENFF